MENSRCKSENQTEIYTTKFSRERTPKVFLKVISDQSLLKTWPAGTPHLEAQGNTQDGHWDMCHIIQWGVTKRMQAFGSFSLEACPTIHRFSVIVLQESWVCSLDKKESRMDSLLTGHSSQRVFSVDRLSLRAYSFTLILGCLDEVLLIFPLKGGHYYNIFAIFGLSYLLLCIIISLDP